MTCAFLRGLALPTAPRPQASRRARGVFECGLALALAACASAQPAPRGEISLVETAPVETTLDAADLRATHEVWLEMIGQASREIDLAHFYASNRSGTRLEQVVRALEQAAARGVRVRFLADEKFYATYPDTLDRLARAPGIEVRRLDLRPISGGVLHAKYMLVDGAQVYVGSANFDWRSLEHIQELGVRARSQPLAAAFARLFTFDWTLAGGGDPAAARAAAAALPDPPGAPLPVRWRRHVVRATPVFSPRGLLPDGLRWDRPALVSLLDGARRTARVQLLSYDPRGHAVDRAVRRAAARGVEVEVLLADWQARGRRLEELRRLDALDHVEVKLVSIPRAKSGFIPFARVVHAKYLVVDDARAWVGTSNWSADYFEKSRNAGFIVEGAPFATRLARFFVRTWTSVYAHDVEEDLVPDGPQRPAQEPDAARAPPAARDCRWPPPTRTVEVVKVVDGDTIHVRRNGRIEKLRLLSVDTEEKISPGRHSGLSPSKPQTRYGQRTAEWAKRFFAALAQDGGPPRVGLVFPPSGPRRDVYGRLLCHVVLPDGTDFNLLLVREGRSPYFNKYGNSRLCHEAFVKAQQEARAARRGIWSDEVNRTPPEGRTIARRPYARLLPWWNARAEAIERFRRRAATDPRHVAADDPVALRAAAARGEPMIVFGEIERFFEEEDGSLTVRMRSSSRREALRVVVPRAARPRIEPMLRLATAEFRQNFLYVTGRVTRGPRGFRMVTADPSAWRVADPSYPD